MPRHLISDAHEWINVILTVPTYYLANPQPRERVAYVEPLVALGYRVVAFDAPAHGDSSGQMVEMVSYSRAIRATIAQFGKMHGIIAHSFGGMTTQIMLYNLEEQHLVDRVVIIAAPSRIEERMQYLKKMLTLPPNTEQALRRMVSSEYGADCWDIYDTKTFVRDLQQPALIIHDDDDTEVHPMTSERISASWKGSEHFRTKGLGHYRVVWDPIVKSKVVEFLHDTPATDSVM
eukprot:TRINITY_DN9654_c0_g1_i1.p1 TRINITY_DN9654_c0_g1~~TRINITY_DN9654_c0_g1_i1.p1  ORF type:complete len:233 (-),score=40.89 TRINITY_DN9654_c0_g1_i1:67-765(-)